MTAIPKDKQLKSKKITDSAKGESCTLRIPGVCNFNPETTVFAHANGAGMSVKAHDVSGCYSCSSCHDWLDGKTHQNVPKVDKLAELCRAMVETMKKLIQKGLITVK